MPYDINIINTSRLTTRGESDTNNQLTSFTVRKVARKITDTIVLHILSKV
ncbi:hypothetical protein KSS87_019622, partial [Heliosperma pusillum]